MRWDRRAVARNSASQNSAQVGGEYKTGPSTGITPAVSAEEGTNGEDFGVPSFICTNRAIAADYLNVHRFSEVMYLRITPVKVHRRFLHKAPLVAFENAC